MNFFEEFIFKSGTLTAAELIFRMKYPRHVRLRNASDNFCLLSTNMVTVAPREEVGEIVSLPANGDYFAEGADRLEPLIWGGARVESYRYLVNTECGIISGVRIDVAGGTLTVLAGMMPHSIFVALADKSWGEPEHPLSSYTETAAYKPAHTG